MAEQLRDFKSLVIKKGDIVVLRPIREVSAVVLNRFRVSAEEWGEEVGVKVLVVSSEIDVYALRKGDNE